MSSILLNPEGVREIGESIDAELKCVGLTSRETQILRHLALGKGDKQIAIDLMISVKTVNHHVSHIILKLDATNRTHAVAKALLTKQIEMRGSDAQGKVFSRRFDDVDKTGCMENLVPTAPTEQIADCRLRPAQPYR